MLPDAPPPVRVLGLDETRRGKGRYKVMTSTGVKVWVDRFETGLVDLVGTGGLFAQVNGRNSAAVIAWLEAQDPEWPAAITHVSMDTSATYARAARIALTQPENAGYASRAPAHHAERQPGLSIPVKSEDPLWVWRGYICQHPLPQHVSQSRPGRLVTCELVFGLVACWADYSGGEFVPQHGPRFL